MIELLRMGQVTRWHTVPSPIHKQTVAEHSWGVAAIIAKAHPNPSAALLKAALFHDLAESHYGDMPANIKWELKGVMEATEEKWLKRHGFHADLTEKEKQWLFAADLLEGFMHATFHVDAITYRMAAQRYDDAIQKLRMDGKWPAEL